MRNYHVCGTTMLVMAVAIGAMLLGCGPRNGLPNTVTVTLPDGSQIDATQGAGVIALADTTWDFFRSADNAQSGAFVRVKFGPEGELDRFENNTIAAEIFGDTLIFDGERHSTTQAGLQYAAATYGAESADETGFTFAGRITAFAVGLTAATAEASAIAEFDADDPNTVRGVFSFSSQVTLLEMPEGNLDDEFSFVGRRVTE